MTKKKASPKFYSGDLSREFWRRVRRLAPDAHRETYALGCILQYVEHHTLAALEAGEGEKQLAKQRKSAGDART